MTEEQREQFRQYLDQHRDDPAVIAVCERLGRKLGGGR
jgi:hypothetical protein